jgi:transposase
MLTFPPTTTIYVIHESVDFRNGIEGIAAICRNLLKLDPASGAVFAYRNKSKTSIKVLFYDSQGFWLCQKRLSSGSFKHWPDEKTTMSTYDAVALLTLLNNGNPASKKLVLPWNKI